MTLTDGAHALDQHHCGEAFDRPRQRQRRKSAAPRSSRLRKAMGMRTPLPDTPSLPIGADEVTVLDHTGRLRHLPQPRQGGRRRTPSWKCAPATGEVVWRFDRDGPKPRAGDAGTGRHGHDLHDEQGGRGRHRQTRDARRHQGRRQDRHHQRVIATPGSSATPATSSAACGSAMTTTARPTA